MKLDGRVALITGAAKRIGRAIALRLAGAGCSIALHYRSSRAAANQTGAECRAAGVAMELLDADLDDLDAARRLVDRAIERFGRLDILVNNASIFEKMPLEAFDLAAFEKTMRINLTAPLVLTHAARDALRAVGGRVVNLCDAAAQRPWPDHLAYVVSKSALETLTRVLARSLAPQVNVVGIAPGVAEWPPEYDEATRERLTRAIPLQRAGTPEEIAAAVEFVLRDGDYITGTILSVDGGRYSTG